MSTLTPDTQQDNALVAVRSRDASNTRQLLLTAARRRFAQDGYRATTVRNIATDAGVNMALISRYFTSKEGLFEACLRDVGERLDAQDGAAQTVDAIVQRMVRPGASSPGDDLPLQLLLLLRTSGDTGANQIRQNILRGFSENIASVTGWQPDDAHTDHLLLRAQIALASTLGVVMLRTSLAIEPLTSATDDELSAPLQEMLTALLAPASPRVGT